MPHPRRRPRGIGGGRRSISGDHRNFSEYGGLTRAKAPAVANQADRVENVSSSGSPLAKPSGRISITRRSVYCAIERRQAVIPLASTFAPSTAGMMNSYHERSDHHR